MVTLISGPGIIQQLGDGPRTIALRAKPVLIILVGAGSVGAEGDRSSRLHSRTQCIIPSEASTSALVRKLGGVCSPTQDNIDTSQTVIESAAQASKYLCPSEHQAV